MWSVVQIQERKGKVTGDWGASWADNTFYLAVHSLLGRLGQEPRHKPAQVKGTVALR